jgi:hypothetical protein
MGGEMDDEMDREMDGERDGGTPGKPGNGGTRRMADSRGAP